MKLSNLIVGAAAIVSLVPTSAVQAANIIQKDIDPILYYSSVDWNTKSQNIYTVQPGEESQMIYSDGTFSPTPIGLAEGRYLVDVAFSKEAIRDMDGKLTNQYFRVLDTQTGVFLKGIIAQDDMFSSMFYLGQNRFGKIRLNDVTNRLEYTVYKMNDKRLVNLYKKEINLGDSKIQIFNVDFKLSGNNKHFAVKFENTNGQFIAVVETNSGVANIVPDMESHVKFRIQLVKWGKDNLYLFQRDRLVKYNVFAKTTTKFADVYCKDLNGDTYRNDNVINIELTDGLNKITYLCQSLGQGSTYPNMFNVHQELIQKDLTTGAETIVFKVDTATDGVNQPFETKKLLLSEWFEISGDGNFIFIEAIRGIVGEAYAYNISKGKVSNLGVNVGFKTWNK